MNILTMNRAIVLLLVVAGLAWVAGGSAQEAVPKADTMGDLTLRSRQEDLDSYWLDTNQWAFYGYRPHLQAKETPFMNLPSYYSGKNYYSFGMDDPTTSAPLSGGLNVNNVPETKYGTWH